MDRHTLQHELDPTVNPRSGTSRIRRPAAPVVELALDLQRRAGNRSVAALVDPARETRRSRPPAMRGPETALAAIAAAQSARSATPAPRAPSVQREPCVDCPDAAPAAAPESDDALEASGGG